MPMWKYDLEGWKVPNVADWECIVDVRSPKEFEEDHIPGAVNLPVLSDEERVIVGTMYKRTPFEARKLGARFVAKNIAEILSDESPIVQLPRDSRILVYCWRGGDRSNSLAVALSRIGWHVARLDGGYKTYRRQVRQLLYDPTSPFYDHEFIRLEGATGTGKGLMLDAVKSEMKVLDLEDLARHRGSVLGGLVSLGKDEIHLEPQPTQKFFETRLAATLAGPPSRVIVEAESAKIGRLLLPPALHSAMVQAPTVISLEVPLPVRVKHLRQTYAVFETPKGSEDLKRRLKRIQNSDRWTALINANRWDDLVTDLLTTHYDPAYLLASKRDQERERRRSSSGRQQHEMATRQSHITLHLPDLSADTVQSVARDIIAQLAAASDSSSSSETSAGDDDDGLR